MYSMSEEQSMQVDAILADLLVRAEAKSVFLCDRGGNILAWNASETYAHEDNICALAAGSFYATRELAKLLGEQEFKCVFHQGNESSVYMQCTALDLLVLVVFGQDSNQGLVKLYGNETCHALDRYLKDTEALNQENSKVNIEFEIDDSATLFRRAARSR